MNDTEITVVGTVLTTPERRKTEKTNAVVTSFRIISNSRRFDKDAEQWIDGAAFRIRVNCWRRLADHVYNSVFSGEPVIVKGRITTREWKSDQGEPRLSYEIEATSVGHDLSRGTSKFTKVKSEPFGSVVEDAESENRVNGEPTQLINAAEQTVADAPDPTGGPGLDDFSFGEYAAGTTDDGMSVDGSRADADAVSILHEAGLDPRTPEGDDSEDDGAADLVGAAAGSGGSGGRGRRRGR